MTTPTTTVVLTPANLEDTRRALLDDLHWQLEYFAKEVDELRDEAWPDGGPVGPIGDDVEAASFQLRRALEALDAVGWPKRGER
jgi:hypothetical protein